MNPGLELYVLMCFIADKMVLLWQSRLKYGIRANQFIFTLLSLTHLPVLSAFPKLISSSWIAWQAGWKYFMV